MSTDFDKMIEEDKKKMREKKVLHLLIDSGRKKII